MNKNNFSSDIKSYLYLFQWLIVALIAGLIGCLCVHFFILIYEFLIRIISDSSLPLFIWPVGGAFIVGSVIYRIEPRARGEGIPSYLLCLRDGGGRLSARETFFKFWAALLTLGTLGNGGFLGPVGRVTAGLMSFLQRLVPEKIIPREHLALFPICGLAAAFGALVHSSLGAGIFAVEIIQKANMRYRQLFPAILASTASVYFSRFFGFEPVLSFGTVNAHFDFNLVGVLILLAVTAGFLGKGFIILYSIVSRIFHRDIHHRTFGRTIRTIVGTAMAFAIVFLVNPHLLGTSSGVFAAMFDGSLETLYGNLPGGIPLPLVLLVMIVLKALANSLTVGSGMSAGFAGPAILMGLMLGASFAAALGIPFGSPEYYALLAAGFAGVFSSTMNTPIATGVLTVEFFGLFYSLPAGLAAVVGFQINRHNTLYDMVLDEENEY